MESFQVILLAATVGATVGVLVGGLTARLRRRQQRKKYSQEKWEQMGSFFGSLLKTMSQSVYYILCIALIWTIYYMVLGIADRGLNEYAANNATLIVSVVTVFSIMIAFYEFSHRNDKQ